MPQASQVAAELRRLADALDTTPEAEIAKPSIFVTHSSYGDENVKDQFINFVRVMPKPFKKGGGWRNDEIVLTYTVPALHIHAAINKDKMCVLVAPAIPAKYECDPVLSAIEEQGITPEPVTESQIEEPAGTPNYDIPW